MFPEHLKKTSGASGFRSLCSGSSDGPKTAKSCSRLKRQHDLAHLACALRGSKPEATVPFGGLSRCPGAHSEVLKKPAAAEGGTKISKGSGLPDKMDQTAWRMPFEPPETLKIVLLP